MSWQRPPADPGRPAMWEGGCRRVFGAVSDGSTLTFGLRETARSYLVLFDGSPVPPSAWNVDESSGSISFERVPPARGWIEALGFGPGDVLPAPSAADIVRYDRAAAMAALGNLQPALDPRFAVAQADRRPAHAVNGGVLGPDGHGWFVPQDEYDMLKAGRGWERIRVPGLDLHGTSKYAGALLGPDGKVYGCPDRATSVLRFDPLTGEGDHIPITPYRGDHVWSNDMFLSGTVVDGIAYGIPFDADFFYRIAPGASRVSHPDYGLDLRGPGKWCGCVLHNGVGYAIPHNSDSILRIRPGDQVDLVPLTTPNIHYAAKWRGGCVLDGILYCAPFDAEYVLAVDLSDMSMRAMDFGLDLSGRFKYWGCAGVNGRLVFAPWHATKLLVAHIATELAYETQGLLQPELFDPRGNFAGAFPDARGRIHLLHAAGSQGMIVVPETGFVSIRRTYGRDFGGGGPPQFLGGGQEDNGLIHYNPYASDAVHWTLDGRDFAVDAFPSGCSGEREPAGVRDFGDHVWILRDSGDSHIFRRSGLEWGYWQSSGEEETFRSYAAPTANVPDDSPKFTWGRNKAFFGLLNSGGSNYALPSSQPYFLKLHDEVRKTTSDPHPILGLSRDQWSNGAVMGADGRIYAIPYNGTHVQILDPVTNLIETTDYGLDLLGRRKWYGGVRAGTKIYGIPFDAPGVLVIDTHAGTAEIKNFNHDLSGRRKYMCGAKRNDQIIFAPCDAALFLVLNIQTGTVFTSNFGLPTDLMSRNLKWGSCVVDPADNLVLGPLGTPGNSDANKRPAAWVDAGGAGYVSQTKLNGLGVGPIDIGGRQFFRRKSEFGDNVGVSSGPVMIPYPITASAPWQNLTRAISSGWNTDCAYSVDHWVYTMTETRDSVFSVDVGDWSTYNDRFDEVPGLRPWLGKAPSAFVKYDDDERAMYPAGELAAYRRSSCWLDPIRTVNNTAYAMHCNGGLACRCTTTQYNHFREYIRDANNFERVWWGGIDGEDGKVYAVPHSLPLVEACDKATGEVTRFRIEPPPGWDGLHLWKDGTWFDGGLVFYPRGVACFCYCDPTDGSTEYAFLPPPHDAKDAWRAWTRIGDEVWGFPYNADYILVWDLATRTATTRPMPDETEDWRGFPWSDAMCLPLSESSPERDPAYLLPYNDDRVGVMLPRRGAAGPRLDLGHFASRFPGTRKWSCWTGSLDAAVTSTMWGIPRDAEGLLVLDTGGAEPYVDDYGLDVDWSLPGKWMSTAEFRYYDQSMGVDETISVTVPYDSEEMIALFHSTGRAVKVEYSGPSLAGVGKWWGAAVYGRIAYFVPYNAAGVLCLTIRVEDAGGRPAVYATGNLTTFGIPMAGGAKWRGAAAFDTTLVMVPYNHSRFLVLTAPDQEDWSRTTAKLDQLGVPDEYLTPLRKWAPMHSFSAPNDDLSATREYSFPAEEHARTLRIARHTNQVQCWMVEHEETAIGWRAVRSPLNINHSYRLASTIPWGTATSLTLDGYRVGRHLLGHEWSAPAKFSAALPDGTGGVLLFPDYGTQIYRYDLNDGSGRWIDRSSAIDNPPGACVEFAHLAEDGAAYCFVSQEWRNTSGAPFQAFRPAFALGDGFTVSHNLEYQDTHSHQPRVASFSRNDTMTRCEIIKQGDGDFLPSPVYTEHRRHGGVAAGEGAVALLPANSGSLLYWSKSDGREGYRRREAQFTTHSSGTTPFRPATFIPHAGSQGLFLLPTSTHNPWAAAERRNNPLFQYLVDPDTGAMEAVEIPIPWADVFARGFAPVRHGDDIWMFAGYDGRDPDGVRVGTFLYRVDAGGAWSRVNTAGLLSSSSLSADARPVPRAFPLAGGDGLVFMAYGSDAIRLGADGSVSLHDHDKTSLSLYGRGISGAAFSDGHLYSVGAAFERVSGRDLATVVVTVADNDLDAGTYIEFQSEFTVPNEGSASVGFAVHLGGRLYIPMDGVPGVGASDVRRLKRFYWWEVDLESEEVYMRWAEGAPSGLVVDGVARPDGSIWFLSPMNSGQRKWIRLDAASGTVSTPVDEMALMGVMEDHYASDSWLSGGCAEYGGRLYMCPAVPNSRSSILYELNTDAPSFRRFGFQLACKDSHKWNGLAYDGVRYAYGAPFNADTVLRLDFGDLDDVKADCVPVDLFRGCEAYTGSGSLAQDMHDSGSGENLSRGAAVTKYGTVWTAPYGGRNAQMLEIRRDGRIRMRRPGPEYESRRKWIDAVQAPDGRIYSAPFDSEEVFILDPGRVLAGSSFANMYDGMDGKGKYFAALSMPDGAWMLPHNAVNVLVVDYANETLRTFIPNGVDLSGPAKWLGYCLPGGDHANAAYCAPFDAEAVLKLDLASGEFAELPVDQGEGAGKWRCLVQCGDMLFAAPYNAHDMLAVDMAAGTAYRFDPSLDVAEGTWDSAAVGGESGELILAAGGTSSSFLLLTFEGGRIWGEAVDRGSAAEKYEHGYAAVSWHESGSGDAAVKAFLVGPCDAPSPATVDLDEEVVEGASPDPDAAMLGKWAGGQRDLDGLLALVPHNHSKMARVNASGGLTLHDVGLWIAGTGNWADVAVVDGHVYMPPFNAAMWLHYDAATLEGGLSGFGMADAGDGAYSLAIVRGSVVHAFPWNAKNVASLDTAAGTVTTGNLGLGTSIHQGPEKWWDYVDDGDGTSWIIPYTAPGIVRLTAAGAASVFTPKIRFSGAGMFSGVAVMGGDAVYAPASHPLLMVEASAGMRAIRAGTDDAVASSANKTGGIFKVDETRAILLPGTHGTRLLARDASGAYSDQALPVNMPVAYAADPKCVSAVRRGDTVYMLPFSSMGAGTWDAQTNAVGHVNFGFYARGQYAGGWLAADGSVMGVPHNATNMLRISAANAATQPSLPGVNLAGDAKWWGCVEHTNGSVYFVPYNRATCVIVAPDGTATETDFGLDLSGPAKYRGGVVRGKYVVFAPYMADHFLAVDTETNAAVRLEDLSGAAGGGRYSALYDDGALIRLAPDSAELPARVTVGANAAFVSVSRPEPDLSLAGEAKFKAALMDGATLRCYPYDYGAILEVDTAGAVAKIRPPPVFGSAALSKIECAAVRHDGWLCLFDPYYAYYVSSDGSISYGNRVSLGGVRGAIGTDEALYALSGHRIHRDDGKGFKAFTPGGAAQTVVTSSPFARLRRYGDVLYSATYDARTLFSCPVPMSQADFNLSVVAVGTSGPAKWHGAVDAGSGAHFALPYDDGRIYYNDGREGWAVQVDGVPIGTGRWRGGAVMNGRLYGCPFDADTVAIYKHDGMEFETDDFGADLSGTEKWDFAFVRGNEIFCMPAKRSMILVLRPDNRTSRLIDPGVPMVDADGNRMWSAWVMRGGVCLGIPAGSDMLAEFDPTAETFTLRAISFDLSGEEQWGCGRLLDDGRTIVFLPWLSRKALSFDTVTRRARRTWLSSRENLLKLRPVWGVRRWESNPSLSTGLTEDDLEDGWGDGAAAEEQYGHWLALSSLSGASLFDTATGELSNPSTWPTAVNAAYDTALGFAYDRDTATLYGIPHNGRGVLKITCSPTAPSAAQDRMGPDPAPASDVFSNGSKDPTTWRVYRDMFSCCLQHPSGLVLFGCGSSLAMYRIEPFTGFVEVMDMDSFQGWGRPIETITLGNVTFTTDHNRYDLRDRVHGTAAMGMDGLAYFLPAGGNFGMAWSGEESADRVCMPMRLAVGTDDRSGWDGNSYAASVTSPSGVIYGGGGREVTAGRLGTSADTSSGKSASASFSSDDWPSGENHADANGVVTDLTEYRLAEIETGVWSWYGAAWYASPLFKGT